MGTITAVAGTNKIAESRPTHASRFVRYRFANCVIGKRLSSRRLIQIFNRYLEPGGEEAWVANLERSFDLPTCYFDSSDWTGPDAPNRLSQALRLINNPASLERLREMQNDIRAEAWIMQNAFPTGSAAIYREAKVKNIPLIQYIHNFRPFALSYLQAADLEIFPHRARMYLKEIMRGSWQNSRGMTAWLAFVLTTARFLGWFDSITAWIAVSDFMRDQFIRAGVPPERIFTLRHFWRPVADLSKTRDDNYYLFIGRLVELKGILVLLDTWDKVYREQGQSGPRLVIIGGGELERLVRLRTKQNPLVDFRGIVSKDEKLRLLNEMRALVAPSLCLESLGLVTYEAFDFGKPVLAARAGALGEIVLHGQTGLLHEPANAEDLYENVLTIESEPQTRLNFGRLGREWLVKNADEEEWVSRFNHIVEFAVAPKT